MNYDTYDDQLTVDEEIQRIRDLSKKCSFDFDESPELLELLSLPVPDRIREVANDVRTRTDRYREIDFFNLGAALYVDFDNLINDNGYAWLGYCYEERYSFEEYLNQGYVLEDLIPAAADKLDPVKFSRLIEIAEREAYPDPLDLSKEERDAIALANDQHRLDGWAGGYGNFFETFCVSIGSDELWFGVRHGGGGGPCEAQWDGIWSPYDYRDKNGFPYLDPDLYISLFLNDL